MPNNTDQAKTPQPPKAETKVEDKKVPVPSPRVIVDEVQQV